MAKCELAEVVNFYEASDRLRGTDWVAHPPLERVIHAVMAGSQDDRAEQPQRFDDSAEQHQYLMQNLGRILRKRFGNTGPGTHGEA